MAASAVVEQRELAHRAGSGIEVTLLWAKPTNVVTVAVSDSHDGREFAFEVDGRCALDAFNHPYAYAAIQGARATRMTRLAASASESRY